MDEELVALGDSGPEAGVEHPVGVWGEGEAVARVVVAAFCMLMDMGGLDYVTVGRLQFVAGEGTCELIAAGYIDSEPAVAAFLLAGFEAELPEFLMPVSGCTPYLPRVAAIFFAPKM